MNVELILFIGAFENLTNLEEVLLPSTLKVIGTGAFCNCKNLKSVELPNTLERIDRFAFKNCKEIENIILPKSLKTIERSAFYGCSKLKSITIPSKITKIDKNTFAKCKELTSIEFSSNVSMIDLSAIDNCENLNKVVINNKKCKIKCSNSLNNSKITVCGYTNSDVQEWAKYYELKFKSLGDYKKVILLEVSNIKRTSIKLSWQKVEGVTSYEIYVSKNKTDWTKLKTTDKNKINLKNLKRGSSYYFKVRAIKGNKKYAFSNYLYTKTKLATPKIFNIYAKNGNVTIEWKKISGADSYRVYMATSKNGEYKSIGTKWGKSSTLKYTKKGLTVGKKYYFKIKAENGYSYSGNRACYFARKYNSTYYYVHNNSSYSKIKSIKVK